MKKGERESFLLTEKCINWTMSDQILPTYRRRHYEMWIRRQHKKLERGEGGRCVFVGMFCCKVGRKFGEGGDSLWNRSETSGREGESYNDNESNKLFKRSRWRYITYLFMANIKAPRVSLILSFFLEHKLHLLERLSHPVMCSISHKPTRF